MVSIGAIIKGIFLISLFAVLINYIFSPNFMVFVNDLVYIVACLWTWKDILFQCLVYGDVITPLQFLLRIILVFMLTLLDASFTIILDIIAFPFTMLKQGLEAAGLNTVLAFDLIEGLYASLDLATLSFRVGVNFHLEGILDLQVLFQVSIFGTDPFTSGFMEFDSLNIFGIQVEAIGTAVGQTLTIGGSIEGIGDVITGLFSQIFGEYGAQALYEELIDYLR